MSNVKSAHPDWNNITANLTLQTKGSPNANGRTPQSGDVVWSETFMLDDGRVVRIQMSEKEWFDRRIIALKDILADLEGPLPKATDMCERGCDQPKHPHRGPR